MAKLFKTSIFLLLAAFLLIAEANHHTSNSNSNSIKNHDSDDESDGGAGKPSLKIKLPKFRSGGSSGASTGGSSGGNSGAHSGGSGGSHSGGNGEGCKCGDTKFKEFIKKFSNVYHAYASKELVPELKSAFGKLTEFTMNYLAKEKPDQVNKVHNFLQNSAKATGTAIGSVGGK